MTAIIMLVGAAGLGLSLAATSRTHSRDTRVGLHAGALLCWVAALAMLVAGFTGT